MVDVSVRVACRRFGVYPTRRSAATTVPAVVVAALESEGRAPPGRTNGREARPFVVIAGDRMAKVYRNIPLISPHVASSTGVVPTNQS